MITALKSRLSLPLSLHICGNATPILADMAASGADVLELDYQVDMAAACRIVGPQTAIVGQPRPGEYFDPGQRGTSACCDQCPARNYGGMWTSAVRAQFGVYPRSGHAA